MNIYSTQDFLQKLSDAKPGNVTWEIIQNHFCDIGFDFINLGVMDVISGGAKGLFSNMPQNWINHYLDQEYMQIDPLLIHMTKTDKDFVFTEKSSHMLTGSELPEAQKMFSEVAEVGIRSSFVSSFHSHQDRDIAGFNLGSRLKTGEFQQFLEHNEENVRLSVAMAQCFIPFLLNERQNVDGWIPINDRTRKLTPRETETLNWLANGLRVDRISEKMNISNETVHFHIKSIKAKLNAKTRENAVAIAFLENIIR